MTETASGRQQVARSKSVPALFAAQVRAQFLDVLSVDTRAELSPSGAVILDTPLTLQNGACVRVAIRRLSGGGFAVSDNGYVAGQLAPFDLPSVFGGALARMAQNLSLAWEDGAFRAERANLRDAVWAVCLLAMAMDRALTALELHRASLRKEACGDTDG